MKQDGSLSMISWSAGHLRSPTMTRRGLHAWSSSIPPHPDSHGTDRTVMVWTGGEEIDEHFRFFIMRYPIEDSSLALPYDRTDFLDMNALRKPLEPLFFITTSWQKRFQRPPRPPFSTLGARLTPVITSDQQKTILKSRKESLSAATPYLG